MNILRALDDEQVFAPFFRCDTWGAWRVFLATLFALPVTAEQLAIYQKHTGRGAPPSTPFREAWLVIGRRGGKSFVLATIAVFLACFKDWRPYLSPGEVGTVMVIAADRRQARVIMRYVVGLLRAVPMLARQVEGATRESVTLRNRIVIEVHTASYRSTRGYTIVAALLDEIAYWPSDESAAEPDVEVINAIRPAMATVPGSMLLAASSPYGRRGCLWDAHRRHYGKDDSAVLVWQAATRDMNAGVPQAFIDGHMAEDSARAQAEYYAAFRSDLQAFVDREAVEACVSLGVRERAPVPGTRYHAFTDPSGGSSDSFTLAIGHRENDAVIIDCLRERRPPFSPEDAVAEFCGVLRSYGVTRIQGDRYAGAWPAEQFRKHGVVYEPAAKPKSDLYQGLLPAINSRKIDLLDDARLINQLCSLERRTSRAGKDSIDHAPNAHDDICNVVAGCAVLGIEAARLAAYTSMAWVSGDDDRCDDARAAFARRRLHDHIFAGSRPRLWRSPYWNFG
jgi:hypothetical protein